MTSKEQTDLREEQINSLKWAVDELEKEKSAIATRWGKSQEATGLQESLEAARSEQQSLDGRINEIEGNLRAIDKDSGESLSTDELESQKASLEERICIASERLSVLEQERELEQIALRFRGEQTADEDEINFEWVNIDNEDNELREKNA